MPPPRKASGAAVVAGAAAGGAAGLALVAAALFAAKRRRASASEGGAHTAGEAPRRSKVGGVAPVLKERKKDHSVKSYYIHTACYIKSVRTTAPVLHNTVNPACVAC
jgi:hypothetical protein